MCAKVSRRDEEPLLGELETVGIYPSLAYFVFDVSLLHALDRIIHRLFIRVVDLIVFVRPVRT